jgi:hypothetical protein
MSRTGSTLTISHQKGLKRNNVIIHYDVIITAMFYVESVHTENKILGKKVHSKTGYESPEGE